MRLFRHYRSRTLIVLGYDFQSEGGAWKSVYRLFRYKEGRGEAVMLIDRRNQGTFRQMAAAVCWSPNLIFNGIGVFQRWEGILACLLRRDILLYLHDTAYMLERFAARSPWKYRFFCLILRRNRVLCVSEQMQAYYQNELGALLTHIVREAVARPEEPDFDSKYRQILMVGSMDERKGSRLFSDLAERADSLRLPWKFNWIGALASQSLGPLTQKVKWWGWQDAPSDFLKKADLFFLSSIDDPLPLACLEAMALGIRCVAYRKTGIAELIQDISGCAVYEDYTIEAALKAINKALSVEPDRKALAGLVQKEATVEILVERIDQIVCGPSLSSTGK